MKYLSLQLKGENKIVNTIWKRNERSVSTAPNSWRDFQLITRRHKLKLKNFTLKAECVYQALFHSPASVCRHPRWRLHLVHHESRRN